MSDGKVGIGFSPSVCGWYGCMSGMGVCLVWVYVWYGCVSGMGVCHCMDIEPGVDCLGSGEVTEWMDV